MLAKHTCGDCTCGKFCYALKDFRYLTVVASRFANYDRAKNHLADLKEQLIAKITWRIKQDRKKGIKVTYIRLHESGDFFSDQYLAMWIDIALHFGAEIVLYTYSVEYERLRRFKNIIPDNFSIILSGWENRTVPADLLDKFRTTTVIDTPADLPDGYYLCPASGKKKDPMTCEKCGYMCASGMNIAFLYH